MSNSGVEKERSEEEDVASENTRSGMTDPRAKRESSSRNLSVAVGRASIGVSAERRQALSVIPYRGENHCAAGHGDFEERAVEC